MNLEITTITKRERRVGEEKGRSRGGRGGERIIFCPSRSRSRLMPRSCQVSGFFSALGASDGVPHNESRSLASSTKEEANPIGVVISVRSMRKLRICKLRIRKLRISESKFLGNSLRTY